jgi:Uma2 family endonuclease
MTSIQDNMDSIRQAIRQLTRAQREELAEWMLNLADYGDHVAEAAVAWGDSEPRRFVSVEEYLQMEEGITRYEYVAGEIFAMASPSVRHDIIVSNLMGHLFAQLRGGPCKPFVPTTKLRLRIDANDFFYIPDVTVACGPLSEASLNLQYLTDASVVVEVLSPSTESIDRREKALNYRSAPSLQEYVLIAQRSLNVTVYRRENGWKPIVLTEREDVLELRAAEAHITLAEIYEGVR